MLTLLRQEGWAGFNQGRKVRNVAGGRSRMFPVGWREAGVCVRWCFPMMAACLWDATQLLQCDPDPHPSWGGVCVSSFQISVGLWLQQGDAIWLPSLNFPPSPLGSMMWGGHAASWKVRTEVSAGKGHHAPDTGMNESLGGSSFGLWAAATDARDERWSRDELPPNTLSRLHICEQNKYCHHFKPLSIGELLSIDSGSMSKEEMMLAKSGFLFFNISLLWRWR